MPTLTHLGPAEVRRAVLRFRDALRLYQDELNRLNVYPVPDGDTGTNMALTLESVASELATAKDMAEVCRAVSHGSLMGARGNSGVITSQILRGLADTFSGLESVGAGDLAAGMRRGADAAYQAVLRPVEGTILTVVRETAEALELATVGDDPDLAGVLDLGAAAAADAVRRTPEMLPVLKAAGVVDAGGKGFTLLLDALLEVVAGRPIPAPQLGAMPEVVAAHIRGDNVAGLRYEVMYLLDAGDETIPAFKEAWAAIGDSIVVVGGDGIYNCHIHTNDIGAAVEVGIGAGRPHQIRVTDLDEQVESEHGWVEDGGPVADDAVAIDLTPVTTAVVAVGIGEGVRRLLSSLGVQAIVAGGQSMNPSTAQILEAVERCAADAVVVLPNNKNIIPVAQQVDALTERAVEVIPTTAVVEALTALVGYDPDAAVGANVAAMTEAIIRVKSGEVTQAVRDAVAECGPVKQGDWIALDRSGVCAAVGTAIEAVTILLDHLVESDSEIVTVLLGADARAADTERIRQHLALAHPHVESEFHEGGQPLYPYLVGVE